MSSAAETRSTNRESAGRAEYAVSAGYESASPAGYTASGDRELVSAGVTTDTESRHAQGQPTM